jgi:hypothetical protein
MKILNRIKAFVLQKSPEWTLPSMWEDATKTVEKKMQDTAKLQKDRVAALAPIIALVTQEIPGSFHHSTAFTVNCVTLGFAGMEGPHLVLCLGFDRGGLALNKGMVSQALEELAEYKVKHGFTN